MLLAVLAAIACGVFLQQRTFNPAVLVASQTGDAVAESAARPQASASAEPLSLAGLAGLVPLSPAERFSPDNLYDKIDGKAELYLSAGFIEMRCQRLSLKAAPDPWLEWFVYDMGSLAGAFSVFSTQRRSEGQPLDFTTYGYRTRNGLYFVSGSNYVEALGSAADGPLMEAMLNLAQRSVADAGTATARLADLETFPAEDLVPASQTLQVADAFGFDQFTNVFTARYKIAGKEVTGFITACSEPAGARNLCQAYHSFLLANGGQAVSGPPEVGEQVTLMGGLELVFAEGKFVAGVHAANEASAAATLAQRLRNRLASTP